MLIITMQDSKSKLGTGFGVHDISTDSLLGPSVPKFIKKLTIILIVKYFASAILIANIVSWQGQKLYAYKAMDLNTEEERSQDQVVHIENKNNELQNKDFL